MTRHKRLLVLLPDAMLSDIDIARRYYPNPPPRAEMIRRLIGDGLAMRKHIPAAPASQARDDGPDAVYLNPFPPRGV